MVLNLRTHSMANLVSLPCFTLRLIRAAASNAANRCALRSRGVRGGNGGEVGMMGGGGGSWELTKWPN